VAFVAVTVKVDELPAGIEVGLAAIPTVGGAFVPLKLVPAHPVRRSGRTKVEIIEAIAHRKDLRTRALLTVFSSPSHKGKHANPINVRIH
jgi:hypothetical protein